MNAKDIQSKIENHINSSNLFETKRNYVGMSQISKCPRQIYNEFLRGQEATDERNRMAYLGYAFEDIVRNILIKTGILKRSGFEVVSNFSDKFIGHTDGETKEGDLVEIKSVSRNKFERVLMDGKAFCGHYDQVQMYMRYGGYLHTQVIYVCREDFRFMVIHVAYNHLRANELEMRAKIVLDAVETENAPMCVCGKCG
jgi:hypothetical protein